MEHITNMNKATSEMIDVLTRAFAEDITAVSTDEFEMLKALLNLMKAYNSVLEKMYMKLDFIESKVEKLN
jgi:hypothetical protein